MNLLIIWRDNLIALQEAGTITAEQEASLQTIKDKIEELNLNAATDN